MSTTETLEIKGFEALGDSDKIEGKGPLVHIGYFKNADDARLAARSQGAMGCDGYVEPVDKKIYIYGSFMDYKDVIDEGIKAKALAKLSQEEKAVLGL